MVLILADVSKASLIDYHMSNKINQDRLLN